LPLLMPIGYSRYTNKILLLGDLIALNAGFVLVYMLAMHSTLYVLKENLLVLVIINGGWVVLSSAFELAVIPRHVGDEKTFSKLIKAVGFFFIILVPVFYYIDRFDITPTLILLQCTGFAILL